MNWKTSPFRMWTLGTYVRTQNTEEVPSERTVQHSLVWTFNIGCTTYLRKLNVNLRHEVTVEQRMYLEAIQTKREPLMRRS